MPTPEEKYYDGMNTLLAPVRAAKSLVQTVLLLLIFIGLGIAYPLIQFCNGEPLTLFSFLVPVMTILGVIDLFYVPIYTILTGIACAIVFFSPAFQPANPIHSSGGDFVGLDLTGTQRALIFTALLLFGFLQKFIRNWREEIAFEWKLWRSSKRHRKSTALVKERKP